MICVSVNGRYLGCLCFGDTVRENAAESICALRAAGITQTVMLTGDREAPARAICDAVGIDVLYAGLLPEDKYDHMRQLKREHHVLAVGDGINDALALVKLTWASPWEPWDRTWQYSRRISHS